MKEISDYGKRDGISFGLLGKKVIDVNRGIGFRKELDRAAEHLKSFLIEIFLTATGFICNSHKVPKLTG
jgi:hypothetical protein